MRTSACKGCGAPMVWGRTGSGSTIPLDAEPSSAGVWVFEGDPEDGHVMRAPSGYTGDRYESHFRTCPNASDFSTRKPKRTSI